MTAEGRLARGKANLQAQRFLNNPETLEYISTLPLIEEPKVKKPKEAKDGKSKSR